LGAFTVRDCELCQKPYFVRECAFVNSIYCSENCKSKAKRQRKEQRTAEEAQAFIEYKARSKKRGW